MLSIILFILILLSFNGLNGIYKVKKNVRKNIENEKSISDRQLMLTTYCAIHGTAFFLLASLFAGGIVYRRQNHHQSNSN